MITIIDRFKEWLYQEGKATATIASYASDVKKYFEYVQTKDNDPEVLLTRFLFNSYMKQLERNKAAINTINKIVISLKVFNEFLLALGLVESVFISVKKDSIRIAAGSEGEVTVLDDQQVEQFLFHLEKETERNKLIGYLLLYTGIRVSELVQIQLTDVELLTGHLTVKGKGGKLREVPLRKDVQEALQVYLKGDRASSKHKESSTLLLSQRAETMHRDAVRRWLASVGKQLGFHLHPHLLRHTFATRLLRANVPITTVSKLCGHASVNMTMKYYIHISKEEKQQAVDKL